MKLNEEFPGQLLKLTPVIDKYGMSIEGGTRPGVVFFMIERDKGIYNYKDHGIRCLLLSIIDFRKTNRQIMTGSDDKSPFQGNTRKLEGLLRSI